MRRSEQLPIEQYGFLSDARSSALVGSDGQIDWLTWPRFDSPALCASLLDSDIGGCWWLRPIEDFQSWQHYEHDSLVLVTHFVTASGEVTVTDWLHAGARQALCRLVEGVRGTVVMDTGCDVRRNWGIDGAGVWAERLGYLVTEVGTDERVILDGIELAPESLIPIHGEPHAIRPRARWSVAPGESYGFSLGYHRPGPSNLRVSLTRTREWWSDWSEELVTPAGMYRDVARRSAIVLRGLQYAPTGAFVAAATTSLPEDPGGERNWDYRYSWVRDAAFTVDALTACGKIEAADSWIDWLSGLSMMTGIDQIQIMYGVDGEVTLTEEELPLAGYGGAKPVRIGNGAAHQRQLDTYGELLDALLLHRTKTGSPTSNRRAKYAAALADTVYKSWHEPDQGIWEARSGPRHYVHSKVMAWVAMDRAVQLAKLDPKMFDPDVVTTWIQCADEIHHDVLSNGAPDGWFQMAYDLPIYDAANLMLGLVGFVEPTDPCYIATVRGVQAELSNEQGWVWRYKGFDDGVQGGENSFTICTLWLVRALVAIGDIRAAQTLFDRVLSCSTSLGLFAEQLGDDGRHWGNFPQAFTHIALIQCAFDLAACEPIPATVSRVNGIDNHAT